MTVVFQAADAPLRMDCPLTGRRRITRRQPMLADILTAAHSHTTLDQLTAPNRSIHSTYIVVSFVIIPLPPLVEEEHILQIVRWISQPRHTIRKTRQSTIPGVFTKANCSECVSSSGDRRDLHAHCIDRSPGNQIAGLCRALPDGANGHQVIGIERCHINLTYSYSAGVCIERHGNEGARSNSLGPVCPAPWHHFMIPIRPVRSGQIPLGTDTRSLFVTRPDDDIARRFSTHSDRIQGTVARSTTELRVRTK